MLRKVVLCSLLIIPATLLAAQPEADLQISVAEITGYGVFKAASTSRRSGFSRAAPAADTVTGVRFTDFTTEIPAELGTNFGFQYAINTTPRGQKMKVKSVIRFPEPGLQNPRGRVYTESVEMVDVSIGYESLHGYGFDEPWELVPGEWVFEIWYRDARIIRKTFNVVLPEAAATTP